MGRAPPVGPPPPGLGPKRTCPCVLPYTFRARNAHHHPSCGSQCDAAIANAISVPTVNVVLAAVLGASDWLSLMPYLNSTRTLITFVKPNTMTATMNAHIEGLLPQS